MSQLQKRIHKIQRREGPGIGFGRVAREQPRAMALIATARNAAEAQAAIDAGADAVLLDAGGASAAAAAMKDIASEKLAVGAGLASLSEADAGALNDAHCDFVVSPLETTDSAAVDTEKMGQLVVATLDMDDNTLRALGPLGLDGLFVQRDPGPMTLAQQLGLVRLANCASSAIRARWPS
jgi:2-keto-3-deoxy-6-phosphogluconate aldolase